MLFIFYMNQNVKTEAAAAIDQLQGAESEVGGLRAMTQRMVLTQSEMVCTYIVAWSLIRSNSFCLNINNTSILYCRRKLFLRGVGLHGIGV